MTCSANRRSVSCRRGSRAPRHEVGAAEVAVGREPLAHLLRGADEVAGASTSRTARPTAAGLARRDHRATSASVPRTNTSGLQVFSISSSSRPTSAQWPLEHLALVRPLVGLAAEVRLVGVAGDHPERELLAAAADPDRRVRLLQRLRVALRAGRRW